MTARRLSHRAAACAAALASVLIGGTATIGTLTLAAMPANAALASHQPGSDAVDAVITAINNERTSRGIPALTVDPNLSYGTNDNTSAGTQGTYGSPYSPSAQDWAANNQAATDDENADDPPTSYAPRQNKTYNGYNGIDDAAGGPGISTGDLVRAFMESTGHRGNLMDEAAEAIGAGVSCDDKGYMHISVAVAGTFAEFSNPHPTTSATPVTAAGSGYTCAHTTGDGTPPAAGTPSSSPTATPSATPAQSPSVSQPVAAGPQPTVTKPVASVPPSQAKPSPKFGVAKLGISSKGAKGVKATGKRYGGTIEIYKGTKRLSTAHISGGYALMRVLPGAYGVQVMGPHHKWVHAHLDVHADKTVTMVVAA